jgi:hypothetical protein
MISRLGYGLIFALTAVSCGGTDIKDFSYGGGQPGATQPEGGEIRHENVRLLGMPEQTWVMVYKYTGPTTSAPFADPANLAQTGNGMYGNCVDERNGSPTWPFTPISGATYQDLTKVMLTGPGTGAGLDIIKTNPANMAGNSTFRKYDFTYGGGAPGDQAGFNASMTTAAMSQPGGDYTIDIGNGAPMTYHMPEAFDTPLNIGKVMSVDIAAGADLVLTWTPAPNDFGESGKEHTKKTHFNFTLFADPNNATNPPQFICFPDVDGHQVVPKAVIDALPAGGLIVNADLSHYMESRDGRRFDLVSIYCNISLYNKQ